MLIDDSIMVIYLSSVWYDGSPDDLTDKVGILALIFDGVSTIW